MLKRRLFTAICSGLSILLGIALLIFSNLEHFRVSYLFFIGCFGFFLPATNSLRSSKAIKGCRTWCSFILTDTILLLVAMGFFEFLINNTNSWRDFIITVTVWILCGVLIGSFDYFIRINRK